MRQVIRRFLKHLDAEKNASLSTIESYRYDLTKFDDYLVRRLGKRFLPGDVSRDHIRDYLLWLSEVGNQRPNVPSCTGACSHPVVFQICSSCRSTKG